ncbi:hypothetical protein FGB62_44g130 [Gracilaria domingensis]|nr:hypothetical protein FGB62_44g130 [Gracilaria domingensis]
MSIGAIEMDILGSENAKIPHVPRSRAGASKVEDGDTSNQRIGGADESEDIRAKARKSRVLSVGKQIFHFCKALRSRVRKHVMGCFGHPLKSEKSESLLPDQECNKSLAEEEEEVSWSPDVDPDIVADKAERQYFKFDAFKGCSEREWDEEEEWFDSFLAPLSFTRVDDTELLDVLAKEKLNELEQVEWVSRLGSLCSLTDLAEAGEKNESFFWGMAGS